MCFHQCKSAPQKKLPAERTSFCNSPKRWPQKPRSSRDKIFFGVVPSTFLQWRLSVANWDAVLLPLLNTRTRARERARPSHHANIRCDPFLAPARARESELHKPPPFNAQNQNTMMNHASAHSSPQLTLVVSAAACFFKSRFDDNCRVAAERVECGMASFMLPINEPLHVT
jgi:hypothetical protein